MRIPMHRFKYTKLTKEQIGTKLKAAEAGPTGASTFSNALNGKTLKIVTQNGPTLEYKFAANRRLTLTESGKQVSAGYGELTLNQTFQMLSGTLTSGDSQLPIVNGRLRGSEIVFEVRGAHYRGRVSGRTIEGTFTSGQTETTWRAVRTDR